MKKFLRQDVVLRVLFIVAGGVAAAIFILRGESAALPALAFGGTLGAFLVSRFDAREDLGED